MLKLTNLGSFCSVLVCKLDNKLAPKLAFKYLDRTGLSYSYVLMSGGVPEITWEVHSGQNMLWVVLSVKGCLQ